MGRNKRSFWLKALLMVILFTLSMGFAVMWLWNWLIPDIFSGPSINFFQALGLLLLSRILVGFGKNLKGNGYFAKNYLQDNDNPSSLSPADKERLKRKFMEKCGWNDGKEKTSGNQIKSNKDEDSNSND